MSARAAAAWGAGVTVVLTSATAALINELAGGWPWRIAASVAVLVSAVFSMWLVSHAERRSSAGSEGSHLGSAPVTGGQDTPGNIIAIISGHGSVRPSPAAVVSGWSLGPGVTQTEHDIKTPIHVTIVNGAFDGLSNAIFDPLPLENVLDLAHFTGREWLIERIEAYITTERRGYIVVQAEAGVGKSALAAHLVWTRPCAYHFTRLEGARSPEQARRSLAAQLIGAWRLHELAPADSFPASSGRPDWLLKVLRAAAERRDDISPRQPLVLVVDGLDEADPPEHSHDADTGVPLGLPRPEHLPQGVFIIATSRFGPPLPVLHGPVDWHTIAVDGPDNLTDMRRFVTDAVTGANLNGTLAGILAAHRVNPQWFIQSLLNRCEGVWMYLRYVLDDIITGRRSPADVDTLPERLAGYYLEQIHRWRHDLDGWQHLGLPTVATLVALRRPATRADIALLTGVPDGEPLRCWLDEQRLRPFLDVTRDPQDRRLYAIRHHSLRDMFEPSDGGDERNAGTREALHEALLSAHRRIAIALIPSGSTGEIEWKTADDYTRSSLAEHAARSGLLDNLACDPGFLLVCDPASLLRYRASVITDDARAGIAAYELALDAWTRCDRDDLRIWWLYVWVRKTHCSPLAERAAAYHHFNWQVTMAMWTGSSHRTLAGHTEPVSTVCALPLPGRTLLVSAGFDRAVRLWDPGSGEQIGQLIGYAELTKALCALVLSDGRSVLVSGGVDGTVRLWDPGTGEQIGQPLTGHTGEVSTVCTLPLSDGRNLLASAGFDRTVRLWDSATGEQVGQLIGYAELTKALCALVLSDGRSVLVSGGVDGTVRLWDPDTGEQVGQPLTGHTGEVSAVCALPLRDGRNLIASAGLDATVRLWNPGTGEQIGHPLTGHTDGVSAVCAVVLPDRRSLLASAGLDRMLRLWDPLSGEQPSRPLAGHTDEVSAVCALPLPDGRSLLASAGLDRVLRLWDPLSGEQPSRPLIGHTDEVSAVCALPLPDGRSLLASAGLDRVLRLWDPGTGEQIGQPLTGHTDGVRTMCVLPLSDGRNLLASGGLDGTVRLWDPDTAEQIGDPLTGHTDGVSAVCALPLPDGRNLLASAGLDRVLRLWNPLNGKQIGHPFTGHTDWVSAVCTVVLPDGHRLLASAGVDCTVRLWDPGTGKQVGQPLTGHKSWVTAVCALPLLEGRNLLASAGLDRMLRLWDPVSGEQVGQLFTGHTGRVTAVCALPLTDGHNLLVSAGVDGTVRIGNPSTRKQIDRPLTGHTGRVAALCILPTPEGSIFMVTAGEDRTILVWNWCMETTSLQKPPQA